MRERKIRPSDGVVQATAVIVFSEIKRPSACRKIYWRHTTITIMISDAVGQTHFISYLKRTPVYHPSSSTNDIVAIVGGTIQRRR